MGFSSLQLQLLLVAYQIHCIIRAVYLEYIVLRSSQEVGQFIEGLQTLGIATLIKHHPKELLVYDGTAKVTAQYLSELFVPILSPRGHNQREEEEAVVLNWRDYLQDIEGILRNCMCDIFYSVHDLL